MGDYSDALLRNPNSAVQARAKAQNRNNVMQLKLIGQSHSTGLTPNLLKLFEPRPPLEYKPAPEKRKCPPYTGMAQFVSNFAEPGDPQYAPPVQEAETHAQRRARIHKMRLEEGAKKAAEELEKYDTKNDPNISGDPYKTLFVARLNYEMTESRIKREFEAYGPIKRVGIIELPNKGSDYIGFSFGVLGIFSMFRITSNRITVEWSTQDWNYFQVRLVTDKETNKPRGYAFIEYMHTRDMKAGYKQADGKKIDNRRVLVDVERGRTVPNWRPRRLGGGLGTTQVGGEEVNQREQLQSRGTSRSEEPRIRDDRDRDREKSRERVRDGEKSRERVRDREKSRERSHEISNEKPRDRDHRDDRHHRDRDRNRDRDRYRERDRGHDRERDHDRELTRDRYRGRDRDRDRERRDHDRHSEKERDRDYEDGDDLDRGHSRDRDYDYDRADSKHERDRDMKEKNDDRAETEDKHGWHEQTEYRYEHPKLEADHDDGHYEHRSRGHYDNPEAPAVYDRYKEADHDQMDEDDYRYDRDTSEPQERDRDYRR